MTRPESMISADAAGGARRRGAVFAAQLAFVFAQAPLALSTGTYGYAEGVYWQTLLNLARGYSLYSEIYYSQLPGFAYTTLLFAGPTDPQLWAGRLGCVLLTSLLIPASAWIAGQLGSGRWAVLAAIVTALSSVLWSRAWVLAGNTPAVAFLAIALGAFLKATATGRFRWWWGIAATLAMAWSFQLKPITVAGAFVGLGIMFLRLGHRAWRPAAACGVLGAAVTLAMMLAPDPTGSVFSQLNAGAVQADSPIVLHGLRSRLEIFATLSWGLGGRGNLLYLPLAVVLSAATWILPERRRLLCLLWVSVIVLALPAFIYPGARPHHFFAALPALVLLVSYLLDSLWEARGRMRRVVYWGAAVMVALTLLQELRLDARIARQTLRAARSTTVETFLLQRFRPGRDVIVGEAQFELARSGFVVPPFWADTSAIRFRTRSLTCDGLIARLSAEPIDGMIVGERASQVDCGRPAFEARLQSIFRTHERVGVYTIFHGRLASPDARQPATKDAP